MSEAALPHSIEAEQQLLGALLLKNDLLHKVINTIKAEHFYDPVHADIYRAILDMDEAARAFTPVTVSSRLSTHSGLKQLGGAKYLVVIAGRAMTPDMLEDYAALILDNWTRRKVIELAQDAVAKAQDGATPASTVAMDLEVQAAKAASTSAARKLTHSHLSAITDALGQASSARDGNDERAVRTGLSKLDMHLGGGLRPGQLVIMAGRPGMCKTTLAQNIAFNVAPHGTVFFASLEMPKSDLAMRWLSCGLAGRGKEIAYQRMVSGRLSQPEFDAMVGEGKRQIALPIVTAERNVRSVEALRSAARRVQRETADTPLPLRLIVVDYLQLIEADAKSFFERVSKASDACKSLAIELDLPVIALAQLNRGVEQRDPPMPILPDLRESGKMEEDADVVLMLYREEYYLRRKYEALVRQDYEMGAMADLQALLDNAKNRISILCEKQRSGATGSVEAFVRPDLCHVYEQAQSWEEKGGFI